MTMALVLLDFGDCSDIYCKSLRLSWIQKPESGCTHPQRSTRVNSHQAWWAVNWLPITHCPARRPTPRSSGSRSCPPSTTPCRTHPIRMLLQETDRVGIGTRPIPPLRWDVRSRVPHRRSLPSRRCGRLSCRLRECGCWRARTGICRAETASG